MDEEKMELDQDLQEDIAEDVDAEEECSEQGVPTEFDRSITWIHRIFARDIDPNDQTRILLRLLMIVGAIWYLGRGFYGIFTS